MTDSDSPPGHCGARRHTRGRPRPAGHYAPYVRETAITFEYEVPSEAEFRDRIAHTLQKYPYLVAEQAGKLLGYSYAGPFHGRAAYDWAVETSIYIDGNCRKMGLGRLLHDAL